jgi:ABC-2 type transport system permease protein
MLSGFPTFRRQSERVLSVKETSEAWSHPSSVQQNVPAWALFGMFFIVVPLAGALVRERSDGMLARIYATRASFLGVLLGKVAAYSAVCAVQFALMLGLGLYVLPVLGAPALTIAASPWAVAAAALAAALAATGYGLLVGSVARTYEQASMFGAVSVVIAAALGGVMVPAYVMPPVMRAISRFSPLGWGLEAFIDLFVRTGSLETAAPRLLALLAFFAATLLLSWVFLVRRGASGLT